MSSILTLKKEETIFKLVDYLGLGFLEERALLDVLEKLSSLYGLYGFYIFDGEYIVKKISHQQALFRLKLANNIKNYRLDRYLDNVSKKKETDIYGNTVICGPDNDQIVAGCEKIFIDIHKLNGRSLSWDGSSKKVKADLNHYEPIDDLDSLRKNAYDYLKGYFPCHVAFVSSAIFSSLNDIVLLY